jgi:hypothetical protein
VANPSPDAIVRRLIELSRMLDQAMDAADQLDDEAVQARSAHRVAAARAFLEATGPMDMRREIAVVKTEDLRFIAEAADQKLRSARERIRVLRDQLDIARSMSAALRSEWGAG